MYTVFYFSNFYGGLTEKSQTFIKRMRLKLKYFESKIIATGWQ